MQNYTYKYAMNKIIRKVNERKGDINPKRDIEMQVIEWWAEDEDNGGEEDDDDSSTHNSFYNTSTYTIRCFGKTSTGASVSCSIQGFNPFYYVKVDSSFNKIKLHHFLNYINSSYALKRYPNALVKENGKYKSCIVEKKDLFGFRNGKTYKYVKLVFNNHKAMMNSRYIFKKPLHIQNVTLKPTKFKLYESNFEGFMRYCHIKDILMAGWIKLPANKYRLTHDTASTDIEVEIDRREVVSLRDKNEMAPFLQASWDIEVYSHDYTFPEPKVKANEIFQIATTYKAYGDNDMLVKHLLTLKKCAPIKDSNVIVEECANEKELIKKWVDTVSKMDPDVFYTWNGDGFDCIYIIERAILYGLISQDKKSGYVLDRLSRLTNTPCVVKKEYFSSSAYGDNEYNRLYIPGRLNYDLLIHYKRGMKKYPSYKLDYIANEILKEGKNDVDHKDIFRFYENGSPEKIREIGEYCFVEGTRVSLPSCSVDIKCLEDLNTDVVTWVDKKGFSTSEKVHFFNNGNRDCLQLTFIDGTQINCTKDHKILTTDGWVEAKDIQSYHKVLFSPEQAFCDYETEKLQNYKFNKEIGILNYDEACIFARILGYLITDGCISESSCYKNYSTKKKYIYNRSIICLGTKIDAKKMQKDIYKLTGDNIAYRKERYTYTIVLPTKLTKMYLSLEGVNVGAKVDSSSGLPTFLKDPDCPTWIIREFMKGMMGGDGSCPCFQEKDDKFSKVAFYQSKSYEHLSDLNEYMESMKQLFKKLGFDTIISNIRKNNKGDGHTQVISLHQKDIVAFYEKIGYAYCVGKTYKLAIAASYYKMRGETNRQLNWVSERVKTLQQTMSISNALKQAHKEIKEKEPIYNQYYSLPNVYTLRRKETQNSKFRKEHFPSVKQYLMETGSYDYFVSETNIKSHVVKSNDDYSPCYYLSIIDKKEIGKKQVYDIEVKDTHNFVANGAVVHNCVQDTALLQKLVDKHLILTNIIQLANVTYVPIGFLTTRGQTIKVFSQVLRKARQMDFLVPHTNFNEDSYPICLKMKDSDVFDEDCIGEYVEIDMGMNGSRRVSISGKISEIVDDTNIIVLSDTEISQEYFNRRLKYKKNEYLVTKLYSSDDAIDDSFTGATVLDPICGFYQDNVAVLDFASLYPTVEISRNLCYSTLVLDPKFDKLPGVKYETIAWDDTIEYKLKHTCQGVGKSGKSKGQVCGKQAYFEVKGGYFCRIHDPCKKERSSEEKYQKKNVSYSFTIVQPHKDENGEVVNKGVIPALLEELYAARKKVKKQMAKAQEEGDKLLASIFDSTQLAIKVSLNSVYGFLSRGQGNLICKPLGQLTTSVGRMLIEQTKQYAEGVFLDYIKENNICTQQLETKKCNLTSKERQAVLKRFALH
jgi:DNA polymerase elongation subunit (family B)